MDSPQEPPPAASDAALGAALSRLVSAGTLTGDQAEAVLRAVATEPAPAPSRVAEPPAWAPPGGWTAVLAEIGGYVGGAFVFGAAAVLLSGTWSDLNRLARFSVLAVPALMLLVAAVTVARTTPGGWQARPQRPASAGIGARRRMVAVFVTVAAALAAGATGVAVGHRGHDDNWAFLAGVATALVVFVVGYALGRSELLHLGAAVCLLMGTMTALSLVRVENPAAIGGALVGIGLGWLALTATGILAERSVGYGWSAVMVFSGGEVLTDPGSGLVGYLVLAALAVAGLAGFFATRLIVVLAAGVISMAVVVPQAVIDATDGALGAAGALLIVGLSIVGASVLGFRLHRAPADEVR